MPCFKEATHLFQQHKVEAAISCVYLPKYKKIGLVLSKQPFGRNEGIGYFINYLKEIGHIEWDEKTKDTKYEWGIIRVLSAWYLQI